MLAAVEIYGAEEGHSQPGEAANVEDSGEPEQGGTETSATGTGEEGGGTTGETGAGDAGRGEQIFAESGCGNCHTLSAAGASGTVGPNLDELKQDESAVVAQVTNGGEGMPAFGDQLSPDEIAAVAAFVVEASRG
ncbi:MAG: cytochrome c [Thermoleophilia bacterium]|nr:cytochrome c [Thermoleophilia bacterium]